LKNSPAVPPKSFGGEAQAGGQKGRGLRGRNFCLPVGRGKLLTISQKVKIGGVRLNVF